MTTTTHRYEITHFDAESLDVHDLPTFARTVAHATFANVTEHPTNDSHRFSDSDVTVRFDATPADVARYIAALDLDDDDVTLA